MLHRSIVLHKMGHFRCFIQSCLNFRMPAIKQDFSISARAFLLCSAKTFRYLVLPSRSDSHIPEQKTSFLILYRMGSVFRALGLSVGVCLDHATGPSNQNALNCDITYVTAQNLAWIYLADNSSITDAKELVRHTSSNSNNKPSFQQFHKW